MLAALACLLVKLNIGVLIIERLLQDRRKLINMVDLVKVLNDLGIVPVQHIGGGNISVIPADTCDQSAARQCLFVLELFLFSIGFIVQLGVVQLLENIIIVKGATKFIIVTAFIDMIGVIVISLLQSLKNIRHLSLDFNRFSLAQLFG